MNGSLYEAGAAKFPWPVLSRTVKPTFFMLGTSAKLRDIHFKLGHDAMLAGVPREFGVSDFHRMLGVYNPLEKFFRETIEHAGLGPIKIGVRRGR